jgi:hypothetical protein
MSQAVSALSTGLAGFLTRLDVSFVGKVHFDSIAPVCEKEVKW